MRMRMRRWAMRTYSRFLFCVADSVLVALSEGLLVPPKEAERCASPENGDARRGERDTVEASLIGYGTCSPETGLAEKDPGTVNSRAHGRKEDVCVHAETVPCGGRGQRRRRVSRNAANQQIIWGAAICWTAQGRQGECEREKKGSQLESGLTRGRQAKNRVGQT